MSSVQRFSIGFKSGKCRGYSTIRMLFSVRNSRTDIDFWHHALSCINSNSDYFRVIQRLRQVINNGKQTIIDNILIFIGINPSLIINNQRTHPFTTKICSYNYFKLCTLECLLNIPGIESLARSRDDPLTMWIDTNPYTWFIGPNNMFWILCGPILILHGLFKSFGNIFNM